MMPESSLMGSCGTAAAPHLGVVSGGTCVAALGCVGIYFTLGGLLTELEFVERQVRQRAAAFKGVVTNEDHRVWNDQVHQRVQY